MTNLKDKKYFSKQITRRFLIAMDNIVGNTEKGKVTAGEFGEKVGIAGSNLTRLRNSGGENFVTIEACGRLCKYYNISPNWLILEQGEMENIIKNGSVIQQLRNAVRDVEKEIVNLKSPVAKRLL